MGNGERVNGNSPEIMAPAGTYDLLQSIAGGMLASNFATHHVTVISTENNPSILEISVKVKKRRQVSPETVYTFRISPEDKIEGLSAQLRRLDPLGVILLPTPKFSEVLEKIHIAINTHSISQRQPVPQPV